jgi:hypothetical protein
VIAKGFAALPAAAGAIAQGDLVPLSVFAEGGGAGVPCASVSCLPIDALNIQTTIDVSGCSLDTAAGHLVLTGKVVLSGPGSCDPQIPNDGTAEVDLTAAFSPSMGGGTILTETLEVSGEYSFTRMAGFCAFDGQEIRSLLATLNGTVGATTASGAISLTLHAVETNLAIDGYDLACVPQNYKLTLGGQIDVSLQPETIGDLNFDASLTGLALASTVTDEQTSVEVDGSVDAICFNGAATFNTISPLVFPTGDICPSSGTVLVPGTGQILYENGGVGIDTDADGTPEEMFDSCTNAALFGCVG